MKIIYYSKKKFLHESPNLIGKHPLIKRDISKYQFEPCDLCVHFGWDREISPKMIDDHKSAYVDYRLGIPIVFITDGCFQEWPKPKYGDDYLFGIGLNAPGSLNENPYIEFDEKRLSKIPYAFDWNASKKKIILICHQFDLDQWGNPREPAYREMARWSASLGLRTVLKLHPLDRDKDRIDARYYQNLGIEVSFEKRPITDYLNRAAIMVTHDSKAVVQSIFMGVPVVTWGKTWARHLVNKFNSTKALEDICLPDAAEFFRWANWISYQHYNWDEIFTGDWMHIIEKYLTHTKSGILS